MRLFANDENLGFSAANNIAIRASGGDYVLALNPDTEVTAGALERLCALLDARPEIGIAGPALEQADGSPDHAAKRSFPTPLSALGHFTGVGRRRETGALADYRAPEVEVGPVDAVNGAFMLIRRRRARPGRALRRGLLDVHGGPRPLLPVRRGRLDHLVRAVGDRQAHQGRNERQAPFTAAQLRLPLRHATASTAATTRRTRNPLLNAAVYAGIAVKLATAVIGSARGGRASVRRARPAQRPLS